MQHLMLVVVLVSFLLIPFSTYARHTSNRINTSSLDDEIVKSIPIPVLFGIEYENIYPDFGDPRGDGTREHEGEDLAAPQGTPIVSPTEAIVLRTGTGESAGKYVYTANPGGEVFRYMHLDVIADLERGEKLSVGDFIGMVGDTGNASPGAYHLHLEIRDEDNDPTDPYPRLTDTFTLKEKMSFLDDIFRDVQDDDEYAAFLVSTFATEFREAVQKGYEMPRALEDALEDAGIFNQAALVDKIRALMERIPPLLTMELEVGDQGTAVTLLQFYLIYMSEGAAHDRLVAAGATGYFGPVTEAAVKEYQEAHDVTETGLFTKETQSAMLSDSK